MSNTVGMFGGSVQMEGQTNRKMMVGLLMEKGERVADTLSYLPFTQTIAATYHFAVGFIQLISGASMLYSQPSRKDLESHLKGVEEEDLKRAEQMRRHTWTKEDAGSLLLNGIGNMARAIIEAQPIPYAFLSAIGLAMWDYNFKYVRFENKFLNALQVNNYDSIIGGSDLGFKGIFSDLTCKVDSPRLGFFSMAKMEEVADLFSYIPVASTIIASTLHTFIGLSQLAMAGYCQFGAAERENEELGSRKWSKQDANTLFKHAAANITRGSLEMIAGPACLVVNASMFIWDHRVKYAKKAAQEGEDNGNESTEKAPIVERMKMDYEGTLDGSTRRFVAGTVSHIVQTGYEAGKLSVRAARTLGHMCSTVQDTTGQRDEIPEDFQDGDVVSV